VPAKLSLYHQRELEVTPDGSCACDVVFINYGSETISHADMTVFLEVVVVLEMIVVLHCNPRLIVGNCFGRQVIPHSFRIERVVC
jgi:hypothetical protein